MADAEFRIEQPEGGPRHVILTGRWSLRAVDNNFAELHDRLAPYFGDPFTRWDLREIEQLDSAAAAMLLSAWCDRWEDRVTAQPEQAALLAALVRPASG